MFSNLVVFLGMLIGFLFVLLGIIIYIMAYVSYKKSLEAMAIEEDTTAIPLRFLFAITSGMVLTALLIAFLLLFL